MGSKDSDPHSITNIKQDLNAPLDESEANRDSEFVDNLTELSSTLDQEYKNWGEDVCKYLPINVKQSLGSSFGQDWDESFKSANQEDFIEFVARAYFCPDRETYEDEVRLEDRYIFLLPPQREVYDRIDGMVENFAVEDKRKTRIKQMVEHLSEEPWDGEDISDIVYEFGEKYQKEVMS